MKTTLQRFLAVAILGFVLPIQATTLSITSNAPVPGANDIYNFTGAAADSGNVNDGGSYTNGAGNDGFTYVAGDQTTKGQTFTTGSMSGGYMLSDIWVQHVGYTTNTSAGTPDSNGTWWQMISGSTLTLRVTDPSQAGSAGFVVASETYATTGSENATWGSGSAQNSVNGDGMWLHFTLATPVALSPNTQYGFDLTSSSNSAFFEWLGTDQNVLSGGGAYRGSTVGTPDDTMNSLVGDRVFLVSLSAGTNAPTSLDPRIVVPFDLTNVTLLPSQFQTNMLMDKEYLLSLDPDRLLYSFRANVGLSTSNAAPYGGWESPSDTLCLGHFVGHYLSACSMMYASTDDPQLKERVDYVVGELAKCQAASPAEGFNPGYLSAFPEYYIDDVINQTQNGYFSVPWYTLHKIMAGLLDAYQHADDPQALTVVTNMANWIQFRMDQLTSNQIQNMLNYREYGGMNEVLANLSVVTGNTNYLRIAEDFNKQSLFTPLSEEQDVLDGLHDNTQIPEIIGAAREYELTGDPTYHEIASFFWDRVANYRSYVIGGSGDAEHFFPITDFPLHVDAQSAETCCTYNILKLTRHLFEWSPSAAAMDFYERGLYNQILGSEVGPGEMTYFVSVKPGHFKTYSTPYNSFWCCDGTGVENHSKYGNTIYFHNANSLYLNLFIPSILNWPGKGLTVRQDTAFPQSDTTTLTFQCTNTVPLTLKIRYPSWAQSGMFLSVNGVSQTVTNSPGSYVSVTRNWQNNDQVLIRLPMTLRTETLQDTSNTVALFYGPILLAGALGTNGMPASDLAVDQWDLLGVADPLVPFMIGDTNSLLTNVVPVAGQPLTFRTQGIGEPNDVTLIPFYQVRHQRYSVYWNMMSQSAWQQFANSNAVAEARIIDQVSIGDSTSESAHNLQQVNSTTGSYNGRNWRDANENRSSTGWFSYDMMVQPNAPVSLDCTYWGNDSGGRVFDILVDGTVVATQTLTNNNPGQFFDVEYPLPTSLTTGRTNVTVEFNAHSGQIAGGVFGLQTISTMDPGAFLGITMNVSTNVALGTGAQFVQVMADFQNLTNQLSASSQWLVLTSSDTNVISVGPDNELIMVGSGTARITADYLGQTVSQTIEVASVALHIELNGNDAVILWPSNTATLQSAYDLGNISDWSSLTDSIATLDGTNSLTVPITNRARYFRLSYGTN